MLTIQELRQLQTKEISEELTKVSRELIKARIEHSSQTLKETHKLNALKRHIAVIKTVMKEAPAEAKTEQPAETKKPTAKSAKKTVKATKAKSAKKQ